MIIWIASYPRSGNTFLRVVLKSVFGLETYSIYDDKFDIAQDAATAKIVGHRMLPDDFDLETARNSQERYIIKTHDHVDWSQDKVIYLVRDGRESVVSYLNYIKCFSDTSCRIEDVLYGNVPYGTWGEHVGRYGTSAKENVLSLKFESFVMEPMAFLERLSKFLGVKVQSTEIPGFEKLHAINPKFFRRGKSDSWRGELNPDEILSFWLINYSQMMKFYPEEVPPRFFTETEHALEISRLFCKQTKYFEDSWRGLQTELKSVTDERNNLLKQRDKLLTQRAQLRDRVSTLSAEFSKADRKLTNIEVATKELSDIKAVKAPIKKYHAYKKLLHSVFPRSTKN